MTVSMEVKLFNKLLQLEELMYIADMSKPAYPVSCRHLRDALETRKYSVRDLFNAENALISFHTFIRSGHAVARELGCVEVINQAALSLATLLRRVTLMEQGTFPVSPTHIEEALLWNCFTTTVREVDFKWFKSRNWDVLNPSTFLKQSFPGAYSQLSDSDVSRLESCGVSSRFDLLEKEFRYPIISKQTAISCSNKLKTLNRLRAVYDFSGIGWRFFYGPTRISFDVGFSISSDIAEVELAYMKYRNLICNACKEV